MSWKTNLEAASVALNKTFTRESPAERRQKEIERLENMDSHDLMVEQIMVTSNMLTRLEGMDRELVRIRNNVVFFFWVFILSIVFWIFALIAGLGSMMAGMAA